MTEIVANDPIAPTPARRMARIAGALYVLNIVTSLYSYFGPRGQLAFIVGLIATAAYIAITVLFYILFNPVSRSLSLVAALFSMAGSATGFLGSLHLMPFKINPLVFFGFYCILIGYLILRSIFLPRFLGVLMAFAGLGYLAFLWPYLGKLLFPYDTIPGGIGEFALPFWLLIKGVDEQGWNRQASAARS